MFRKLNKEELVSINGGHHGEVHNAGEAVGKFITKVAVVLGIGALFFVPKS